MKAPTAPEKRHMARVVAKPLPSQEMLREMFSYIPETGALVHTGRGAALTPMRSAGRVAFINVTAKGYHRGGLLGRNVMAHRVVWKWHWGTEPEEIDHINGNPSDNRIENLRAATRQDNVRNTRRRKTNKSGVQGVYFHHGKQAWIAGIRAGGKQIELGRFHSIEDAAAARKQAEVAEGYHPNHGRVGHGV